MVRGWRDGHVVNIHGRAVGKLPIVEGKELKKAYWAKGILSANVLMWNEVEPAKACIVIVAEGITDFLTFCAVEWRSPVCVFGATSGGFVALDVPRNVPIVTATDHDEAGDAYEAKMRAAMPLHHIARVQLPNGVDVNDYAMASGDVRALVGDALST